MQVCRVDKYFSGAKRKTRNVPETDMTVSAVLKANSPKSKTRKYDDVCLSLGITLNLVGDEERPLCVLCLRTLRTLKWENCVGVCTDGAQSMAG